MRSHRSSKRNSEGIRPKLAMVPNFVCCKVVILSENFAAVSVLRTVEEGFKRLKVRLGRFGLWLGCQFIPPDQSQEPDCLRILITSSRAGPLSSGASPFCQLPPPLRSPLQKLTTKTSSGSCFMQDRLLIFSPPPCFSAPLPLMADRTDEAQSGTRGDETLRGLAKGCPLRASRTAS
ncbi:hypothetical protein AAFF_G00275420 [Aldrovandia affinis]|uniref:Uncharacterized protein n=1 Tax=Aldrovandia affinis TaxID=143900 RepID=A0AAD7WSS9_9TELE|nr:hypothetical protein AAFF_G00275420 [Aldrovandia affinis]